MKQYLIHILVSIDQLLNTILGGHPDETVSSRCGKRISHCIMCKILCRFLDLFDKDHCIKHIEHDEGNSHD